MFITILKTSRIQQWSKNFLLFVPLVLSHSFNTFFLSKMVYAFFSFSFLASAIYILNDLFDKKSDQLHPVKKKRPIANNDISTKYAIALLIVYFSISICLSLQFSLNFKLCLAIYIILNILYSIGMKRIAIVDLLILATFYTIRIITGGSAINIKITFWLMTFSVFWFLSLSIIKKLVDIEQTGNASSYDNNSQDFLAQIGISSGFASIIVACLYINNPQVSHLYHTPQLLWVCLIVLLFWFLHIWHSFSLKKINKDPVIFVLKDKTSLIALIILGIFGLLSVYTY
tara:strand:- start:4213 stop:5070 length:858 start_codon:yes stop_codon:yes gene_type:complete